MTATTSGAAALSDVPTSTPALVACDVEGTLVRAGRRPTPAVLDAIAAVRAAGHHLVVATGRSLSGAVQVARQLGVHDGWVVAANGAVTARVRPDGYAIADVVPLDAEPVCRLVARTRPDLGLAAEVVGTGYRVTRRFPERQLAGHQEVLHALEGVWARPTPRVVVYGQWALRLAPALRASGVTAIPARVDWVDVTAPGVSKATALENIRVELGVAASRTVAVGDGENDLDMLRWAAVSIAMGHAPEVVRTVAGRVTGTLDEDGAATALFDALLLPTA
ncbi:HAD family hydrolase [Promicromonospora iranensis]|uniref:Hydroxymethylpyrimidine pyrophosphatase-like HAD family hydrolase n=1 Tax=Promicromonospora iranensis TaxID=1105144 RepID=A0ABU2CWP7_9MICO|nr:HAD family hydrolase [Promicromonospora iranensis]MDR7385754.1 hydroxymethylpyrimidine pyrophosphatase-like HAD family hydrolase [Promicromonospora iranensis]